MGGGGVRVDGPAGGHRRREAELWRQRAELERRLHDGASLRLSAFALRLGLLRHAADPGALDAGIDELQEELHAVLDELREVSGAIHPPLLARAGLGAALRELADRSAAEVVVAATTERFDAVTEGTAYDVVARCVTPPPPAWPIAVAVRREVDELMVAIVGADPRHVEELEVQVTPLGGSVECVRKRRSDGATITVRIPCG
ncbi:MAG: histidine kinase [Pseudonocardia sp.]